MLCRAWLRRAVRGDGVPNVEDRGWVQHVGPLSPLAGKSFRTTQDETVRAPFGLVREEWKGRAQVLLVDDRLVQCEHGRRAISEVHADGSTTVLTDSFDGRRLTPPQ